MIWTRLLGFLNRITEYITMSFLVLATILILLQIISRSLLGSSFSWTEELTRFLFIWIVFLGAGIAFKHGSHISIEVFFNKLPPKVKMIVQSLVAVLCVIFFVVLFIKGVEITANSMGQVSPGLGIPMGYVYLVIPISGVLQMLNLIDVSILFAKTGKFPGEEGT